VTRLHRHKAPAELVADTRIGWINVNVMIVRIFRETRSGHSLASFPNSAVLDVRSIHVRANDTHDLLSHGMDEDGQTLGPKTPLSASRPVWFKLHDVQFFSE
jgi:hypothetical protein